MIRSFDGRRPIRFSRHVPRRLYVAAAGALLLTLSACQGGRLPPVFGAVFGLEGAEGVPFVPGRVPEPVIDPRDRLIGAAASDPGQCIYSDDGTARRFRAACPEGFEI